MASNTRISEVRQALKTVITAAGHEAFAYPPGDTTTNSPREFVYFDEVNTTQDELTFGGSRVEQLQVSGVVLVRKPGAHDAVAKEAEDAAIAIVQDVEDALRLDPTLASGNLFDAVFAGVTNSQVLADSGNRIAYLQFQVDVESHL